MKPEVGPLFSVFRLGISIHNLNKRSEENMGLSLVQWCLLKQLVEMPGTSAFSLAKSVGIHPSTLTQTLKRLEKKGFVFQTENPKDSRKKIISITKSGMLTIERTTEKMGQWNSILEPLKDDIDQIAMLLYKHVSEKNKN